MKLFKNTAEFKKESDFINDRRKFKRYDIALKMNYCHPETKYSGESFTKNISRYGLRFPADTRFTKGTLLDVSIEDPNSSKFLSLKGRIVWLEEFFRENDDAIKYEIGISLLKNKLF